MQQKQSLEGNLSHILGHKSSLNKLGKIEIIPTIFFNHSDMKALKSEIKQVAHSHCFYLT